MGLLFYDILYSNNNSMLETTLFGTDLRTILIVGLVLFALYQILTLQKKASSGGKLSSKLRGFTGGKRSGTQLSSVTTDFTELARIGRIDPVIGRKQEIIRLAQVLSRRGKNNAILVGAPGVGKTAIVEGLARRITTGEVPDPLKDKRVLSLDVATLMSGTKYRGEFEKKAEQLVEEITSSNRTIILFVDEVHSVIQQQGTEGALNFSDILKPALARGDLQMIGATTIDEYNKYIKTDPALERRFQTINVAEPNAADTLAILDGIRQTYEKHHGVTFTKAALKKAISLTKKKVVKRTLPDKAIDAIDEAAAMVRVSHVQESIPVLLYAAAAEKFPDVKKIWEEIQLLDQKIAETKGKKKVEALEKKREELEANIQEKGVLTVDTSDIEDVVDEWLHDPTL